MNNILTGIRRTPYQSLAIFSSLFFTLFLSIVILFSLSFLYGLLGYIESRPQVTVYFQTQTEQSAIFKLRDELNDSGKVSSIKYISKDEAFGIYKDLNRDNPLLLEMVTADILPASLEIYATKPEYLPQIAEFLKNKPGVDEVNFQKAIIDRLTNLTNIVRKSTLVFFLILLFNTLINLLTIGHFRTALHKDEIELQRYLGASEYYVQKPFLKEGVFFGAVSAVCAFTLFGLILMYFFPFLSSYIRGINTLSLSAAGYQLTIWPLTPLYLSLVFGLSTVFGILISVLTTFLATKKYIK